MGSKSSTVAIKVNLSLDTVRVCRTVGIGNFEILQWDKTDAQSWDNKAVYLHTSSCYCWPLTSAQVPCIWSYVTSRLSIVLITSPPCEGKCHNTISQSGLLWCDAGRVWEVSFIVLQHFALDSPLRAERTPQCPRYDLHELLRLSWACKLSSLDGFHSLGRLSDLWRHTFRMREQTDPISRFLSWRQFMLEASDYPGPAQPSLLKPREEEKMTHFNHKNCLRFETIRSIIRSSQNQSLWKLLSSVQITCLITDRETQP